MARRGSFGTGTNPFGGGNFGGLSQYDIGGTSTSSAESVADLAKYQAQLAWGNGTISDAQYLAVLQQQAATAEPGTRDALSAQNTLADIQFRVGLSEAQEAGLDAEIAFYQQALGSMDPGNLRYRDIEDSLASALARRRSRDYGDIVDAYNAGQLSTEALLSWVRGLIPTLSAEDPDYEQWVGQERELVDRIQGEKDSEVYQEYQERKITPDEFLAYVKGRRDSYSTDSPMWDDWDRRYRDAEKNVIDTKHATRDQQVFDAYAAGKISDKTYLKYLQQRVNGMAADDPDLPTWKRRLAEATFSLTEDELIFRVKTGKASEKDLYDFYSDYAVGLNKGSAEYRRVAEKMLSLKKSMAAPKGGGGGTTTKKPGSSAPALKGLPPEISKKVIGVGEVYGVMSKWVPNAAAPSKNRRAAEAALNANYKALNNAVTNQDKYWIYQDPTRPGATVQAIDPMTGKPLVDSKGKPVMVYGAGYMETANQSLADLDMVKAEYYYDMASVALAKHDDRAYFANVGYATEAMDHARKVQAKDIVLNVEKALDTIQLGIDRATTLNDAATVFNLLMLQESFIEGALLNGTLDDTRRTKLENRLASLQDNPLYPSPKYNEKGEVIGQTGGFVSLSGSRFVPNPNYEPGSTQPEYIMAGAALAPGVRFTLDGVTRNGKAAYGWEYSPETDQVWALGHRTITIPIDGTTVTGDVKVQSSISAPKTMVNTVYGAQMIDAYGTPMYMTWLDANGKRIHAYSIDDGATWLVTDGAVQPLLQVVGDGLQVEKKYDGQGRLISATIIDGEGNVVGAMNAQGQWDLSGATIEWYGQDRAFQKRAVWAGPPTGIGAPGFSYTIIRGNPDGTIDFVPQDTKYVPGMSRLARIGTAAGRAAEKDIDLLDMTEAERRRAMERLDEGSWDTYSEAIGAARAASTNSYSLVGRTGYPAADITRIAAPGSSPGVRQRANIDLLEPDNPIYDLPIQLNNNLTGGLRASSPVTTTLPSARSSSSPTIAPATGTPIAARISTPAPLPTLRPVRAATPPPTTAPRTVTPPRPTVTSTGAKKAPTAPVKKPTTTTTKTTTTSSGKTSTGTQVRT